MYKYYYFKNTELCECSWCEKCHIEYSDTDNGKYYKVFYGNRQLFQLEVFDGLLSKDGSYTCTIFHSYNLYQLQHLIKLDSCTIKYNLDTNTHKEAFISFEYNLYDKSNSTLNNIVGLTAYNDKHKYDFNSLEAMLGDIISYHTNGNVYCIHTSLKKGYVLSKN